jgi:hypothetical protein
MCACENTRTWCDAIATQLRHPGDYVAARSALVQACASARASFVVVTALQARFEPADETAEEAHRAWPAHADLMNRCATECARALHAFHAAGMSESESVSVSITTPL